MDKIFYLNDTNFLEITRTIAHSIKEGAVVFIPTDTVYGLSCNYLNPSAKKRISQIKQRPIDKSYIVLVGSQKEILDISDQKIPDNILNLLPAPLTLVVKNRLKALYNEETIAIRCPKNEFLENLLNHCQIPLISTSANISGEAMLESNEALIELFYDKVDFIVLNDIKNNKPSTLLDISKEKYKILRQGEFVVPDSWLK